MLIMAILNDFPRGCNFFEKLARSKSFSHTDHACNLFCRYFHFCGLLLVLTNSPLGWHVSLCVPLGTSVHPGPDEQEQLSAFLGLCLAISTLFLRDQWMGGTIVWILDLALKDQLSQVSLSKMNTLVPLTCFPVSQWRPDDSSGNRDFWNPFLFFKKRQTPIHFNIIS